MLRHLARNPRMDERFVEQMKRQFFDIYSCVKEGEVVASMHTLQCESTILNRVLFKASVNCRNEAGH